MFSVDFFALHNADCHSIHRPRFSYKDFFALYKLTVCRISTSNFVLPTVPSLKLIRPSTAKLLRSCCWYVAWPCDLDFWPYDLDQLSYMAGHVINIAKKLEDPTHLSTHLKMSPHQLVKWITFYTIEVIWFSATIRQPLKTAGCYVVCCPGTLVLDNHC